MTLKSEIMQQLGQCATREELGSAVRLLCGSFGEVRKVDIFIDRSRLVYCFVDLESEQKQEVLRDALSAFEFGRSVCIELNMHPDVEKFWLHAS